MTTTYDHANRPLGDSSGAAYGSNADGRLTTRPGQRVEWDAPADWSGSDRPPARASANRSAHDSHDRLLTVGTGSSVTRYRYTALTATIARSVDAAIGDPIPSMAS